MRKPFVLILLLSATSTAWAAESHDACVGFIDTVPATITTQGTWCLRKDLATTVTSGAAITVATNNVTIDCNGSKLGGLAAGPASQARGVFADNRLNVTVRNCAIRGFRAGVALLGNGGGHLVEDNRIDQSLLVGIQVEGDGNLIQRNRIFDTGSSSPEGTGGTGIWAEGDIRDNTIDGVIGEFTNGIMAFGAGTEIRGNRIRNLMATADAYGIMTNHDEQSVVDNRILGRVPGASPGFGIYGVPGATFCRDNLIANMLIGITLCEDNGGNVVHGDMPPP